MNHSSRLFTALALTAAIGCEDDHLVASDPYQPFENNDTTVLGGDDTMPVATGQPNDDGCIQVTEDSCIAVTREGRYCSSDTGPVDAVVVEGMVTEVVCYATGGKRETVVDTDSDGDIDVPQNQNGTVITFDPSTDGMPFVGNLTVDGNNVTIYGNGPDKSIIEGNLIISGNNARVRGIRVKGNVTIDLNTGALVLSVVEGNLHIKSNNSLAAQNDIFGNVKVEGNNIILVGNDVGGKWEISGSGNVCDHNRAFMDSDANMSVAPSEIGDNLSC